MYSETKEEGKNKVWWYSEPYPAFTGVIWPPLPPASMEPTWSPFLGKAPIGEHLQGRFGESAHCFQEACSFFVQSE